MFLYVELTQSWNILGGYAGYLNFGLVTFFGIGAYASAILFHLLRPFAVCDHAGRGGVAAAVAGLIIGIPTLQVRGAYFALVTMIVTFAVQIVALNAPITQGALGIYLPRLPLTPLNVERLFLFRVPRARGAGHRRRVSGAALEHRLGARGNPRGRGRRRDRRRADGAGEMGGERASCFIAGVVGGLYAQRIAYIEPTGTFSFDISLNVVLMAVIGGAGTWQGPVIGTPIVLLVADLLRVTFTSEVNRVIFSLIVILIALFVPGGVMGVLQRWRRRRRRTENPDKAS